MAQSCVSVESSFHSSESAIVRLVFLFSMSWTKRLSHGVPIAAVIAGLILVCEVTAGQYEAEEAEDNGERIVNDRPIQIGGDPHENGPFFQGSIAEVAVYGTVLSSERVRAHALAGGLKASQKVAEEPQTKPVDSLSLTNDAGLAWELICTGRGWALGRILVRGKPLEVRPLRGFCACVIRRQVKCVGSPPRKSSASIRPRRDLRAWQRSRASHCVLPRKSP